MSKLPFSRQNYIRMIIGLVVIALGFTLMAMDSEPHGFGFLGLTLGPIVAVAGFVVEVFAVLYTEKEKH